MLPMSIQGSSFHHATLPVCLDNQLRSLGYMPAGGYMGRRT